MELIDLAKSLGIANYPEKAEAVYASLGADDGMLYSREYLRQIHEEYGVLAGIYEETMAAADALRKRPELCLWGRLAVACLNSQDPTLKSLPMPSPDGTVAGDLLALLVILQQVPSAYRLYRAKGFSHEVAIESLGAIPISQIGFKVRFNRFALDAEGYIWMQYFTGAKIFRYHSLNFQTYELGNNIIVLRNKNNGEFRIVMFSGRFHRTGRALGCAGFNDEEGAFDADFRETEEGFYGYVAVDALVDPTLSFFSKSDWECALRPGDNVINLHIPRGCDLSTEAVKESLVEGMKIARSIYPDLDLRGAVCYSWLLDPLLEELLGKEAKIARFMRLFSTFPLRSNGTSVIARVFPGCAGGRVPVEEYPEDSTLQRNLKRHMLNGGYLYDTGGVVLSSIL